MQPVIRLNRARRGGRGGRGRGRGVIQGRRAGATRLHTEVEEENSESEHEEVNEDYRPYRGATGRTRTAAENDVQQQRNVRQRPHSKEYLQSDEGTSSEEDATCSEYSTFGSSCSASDQNEE